MCKQEQPNSKARRGPKLERVIAALARRGLDVTRDGSVWSLRAADSPDGVTAEVLLPDGFELSTKAADQLLRFAAACHPEGGEVVAARATPDFHAGARVPVGAVVATSEDMLVPEAIGTDINCGMRLHVVDLDLDRFLAHKAELIDDLRGDLLLGTRDLPMRVAALRALYEAGAPAWLEQVARDPLGRMRHAELDQLEAELERTHELGSFPGSDRWLPKRKLDVVRDPCLGTPGGGNHFVELQVVEAVLDSAQAHAWGVREGQLAFMVHSGSRSVGVAVGEHWRQRARELWPEGLAHPRPGVFAIHGDAARSYLEAMSTAANYASVNRLLLAELVRLRLRERYGALEVPLIWDGPHNLISVEAGRNVHRKGATPAHAGEPVLIPGSMGQASFLMVGLGSEQWLASASHGAGRALTRHAARHLDDDALGLAQVECVALHRERLREEAPAAYKAIAPVIDVQVEAGIVAPVARMRPLLTFKA
ncbi:RtcB family protein [Pseudenhygromyxa sp. WMMC2535]|uniref:RtcB family protein n=1 Tax=Pseudenhygromyxa sp. WMMC2535 TaxID=2712867 RepID=UPI00155376AB|nr:RtcB family protein [Pseudenhygromyxa sp. WMMC2535]NVB36676.1 RtcB family protein [Pseudenhygromyxa sp. WMMC2535]